MNQGDLVIALGQDCPREVVRRAHGDTIHAFNLPRRADDEAMITDSYYVVVSSDSGKNWRVIDISCEQLPRWVKGEYPPYDGQPAFPVATVERFKRSH